MATPSVNVKVEVTGPVSDAYREILSAEALEFLGHLVKQFEARRLLLLERRSERQADLDAGQLPDFLEDTADLRRSEWTVAPIPKDLADPRLASTVPVD